MNEGQAIYPWGGRFVEGNRSSSVAVVTLSEEFELPAAKVALYGSMKTENLGVEKVVANVVSNNNIRHVIVCGTEVRGHRSGDSLVSLWKSGIDGNNKVIGAKSAIPFIENLPPAAIERFRKQVEVVDMIDNASLPDILARIDGLLALKREPYNEGPLVVEPLPKDRVQEVFHTEFALHSRIDMDMYGVVSQAPEAG